MQHDIEQGHHPRSVPAGQWAFEAATAGAVALGVLLAAGLQAAGHLSLVGAARHAWQVDQALGLQAVIDPPATTLLLGLGLVAAAEFLRRGAAMRGDLDGLV